MRTTSWGPIKLSGKRWANPPMIGGSLCADAKPMGSRCLSFPNEISIRLFLLHKWSLDAWRRILRVPLVASKCPQDPKFWEWQNHGQYGKLPVKAEMFMYPFCSQTPCWARGLPITLWNRRREGHGNLPWLCGRGFWCHWSHWSHWDSQQLQRDLHEERMDCDVHIGCDGCEVLLWSPHGGKPMYIWYHICPMCSGLSTGWSF